VLDIEYTEEFNPRQWLKGYAKQHKLPKSALLAMAATNDPFNRGQDRPAKDGITDFEKAEWYRRLHEKHAPTGRTIHLRGLHYRIVNSPQLEFMPDGITPYLNTKSCWEGFLAASKIARLLRKVDPEDLVDRKNVGGVIHVGEYPQEAPEPSFSLGLPPELDIFSAPRFEQPTPDGEISGADALVPSFSVSGYDYDQGAHEEWIVEIWSEKSGDDSTIRSLALRYDCNFVPASGFNSITAVVQVLKRLENMGKKVVILYLSDHDPAGEDMPPAIARQFQFRCWEFEEIAEEVAPSILVDKVAVTPKQKMEWGLPGVPVKATHSATPRFEALHGPDAGVEIDALEAIYPGRLASILEKRIKEFRDDRLARRFREAHFEAQSRVETALEEIEEDYTQRVEDIQRRLQVIAQRYEGVYEQLGDIVRERYDRLAERYGRHVAPLREELQEIQEEIERDLEELEVELPELPEPEIDPDREKFLFDSERGFIEQTARLRAVKGKS